MTLRIGRHAGRVGMIDREIVATDKVVVRFGPDGPKSMVKRSSFRLAYPQEIAPLMGCRVEDLDERVLRRAMALD